MGHPRRGARKWRHAIRTSHTAATPGLAFLSVRAATAPRSSRSSPVARNSFRSTNGTAGRFSFSGPGPRRTWSSPRSSSAFSRSRVFGLGFWEAALALILGSAIGGITQGILSLRGPKYGVPQMVLSRLGFGYWGNALPAGLNSVTAGIGWFAVNSVSGALRAERADPPAPGALPAHHRGGAGRGGVLRLQPGAPVRAIRLPHPHRHLPDRVRGHPEQGPSRARRITPSPARSC